MRTRSRSPVTMRCRCRTTCSVPVVAGLPRSSPRPLGPSVDGQPGSAADGRRLSQSGAAAVEKETRAGSEVRATEHVDCRQWLSEAAANRASKKTSPADGSAPPGGRRPGPSPVSARTAGVVRRRGRLGKLDRYGQLGAEAPPTAVGAVLAKRVQRGAEVDRPRRLVWCIARRRSSRRAVSCGPAAPAAEVAVASRTRPRSAGQALALFVGDRTGGAARRPRAWP
jgi:hypothetical protein